MSDTAVDFVRPEALAAEVRRLAEANPDYVYTDNLPDGGGCSYLEPPCIAGQAAANLGMPTHVLKTFEGMKAMYLTNNNVHPDSLWVNRVQSLQDSGLPWGEAVKHADRNETDEPFPAGV